MSKALNEVLGYANEDSIDVKKHWVVLLLAARNILIRIAIVLFVCIKWADFWMALMDEINSEIPGIPINLKQWFFVIVALITLIRSVVILTHALVEYYTVQLSVNNIRIFGKSGIVEIGTINTSLDHVGSVVVQNSFWGEIFHYGSLVIDLNGRKMRMRYMKNAQEFQDAIILLQEAQKEGRNLRQAERHADIIEAQTQAQVMAIAGITESIRLSSGMAMERLENNTPPAGLGICENASDGFAEKSSETAGEDADEN